MINSAIFTRSPFPVDSRALKLSNDTINMRNSKYITVRYLREMIINDLSLMKLYLHVRFYMCMWKKFNCIFFIFFHNSENGTLSKRAN